MDAPRLKSMRCVLGLRRTNFGSHYPQRARSRLKGTDNGVALASLLYLMRTQQVERCPVTALD
jgi:hypothetical protein